MEDMVIVGVPYGNTKFITWIAPSHQKIYNSWSSGVCNMTVV